MDNVTLFLLPTFIISVSCIFIISLKHKRYKVKELINKCVADKVDNENEVKLCVQYVQEGIGKIGVLTRTDIFNEKISLLISEFIKDRAELLAWINDEVTKSNLGDERDKYITMFNDGESKEYIQKQIKERVNLKTWLDIELKRVSISEANKKRLYDLFTQGKVYNYISKKLSELRQVDDSDLYKTAVNNIIGTFVAEYLNHLCTYSERYTKQGTVRVVYSKLIESYKNLCTYALYNGTTLRSYYYNKFIGIEYGALKASITSELRKICQEVPIGYRTTYGAFNKWLKTYPSLYGIRMSEGLERKSLKHEKVTGVQRVEESKLQKPNINSSNKETGVQRYEPSIIEKSKLQDQNINSSNKETGVQQSKGNKDIKQVDQILSSFGSNQKQGCNTSLTDEANKDIKRVEKIILSAKDIEQLSIGKVSKKKAEQGVLNSDTVVLVEKVKSLIDEVISNYTVTICTYEERYTKKGDERQSYFYLKWSYRRLFNYILFVDYDRTVLFDEYVNYFRGLSDDALEEALKVEFDLILGEIPEEYNRHSYKDIDKLSNVDEYKFIQKAIKQKRNTIKDTFTKQDIPSKQAISSKQDISSKQAISEKQDIPSKQAIPSKQDISRKQDISSKQDTFTKQDIPSKQDVSEKQDVLSKQDVSSKQGILSKQDISSKQDIPSKQAIPSKQDISKKQDVSIDNDSGSIMATRIGAIIDNFIDYFMLCNDKEVTDDKNERVRWNYKFLCKCMLFSDFNLTRLFPEYRDYFKDMGTNNFEVSLKAYLEQVICALPKSCITMSLYEIYRFRFTSKFLNIQAKFRSNISQNQYKQTINMNKVEPQSIRSKETVIQDEISQVVLSDIPKKQSDEVLTNKVVESVDSIEIKEKSSEQIKDNIIEPEVIESKAVNDKEIGVQIDEVITSKSYEPSIVEESKLQEPDVNLSNDVTNLQPVNNKETGVQRVEESKFIKERGSFKTWLDIALKTVPISEANKKILYDLFAQGIDSDYIIKELSRFRRAEESRLQEPALNLSNAITNLQPVPNNNNIITLENEDTNKKETGVLSVIANKEVTGVLSVIPNNDRSELCIVGKEDVSSSISSIEPEVKQSESISSIEPEVKQSESIVTQPDIHYSTGVNNNSKETILEDSKSENIIERTEENGTEVIKQEMGVNNDTKSIEEKSVEHKGQEVFTYSTEKSFNDEQEETYFDTGLQFIGSSDFEYEDNEFELSETYFDTGLQYFPPTEPENEPLLAEDEPLLAEDGFTTTEPKFNIPQNTNVISFDELEQEVLSHSSYIESFKNKIVLCNYNDDNGVYYDFLKLFYKTLNLAGIVVVDRLNCYTITLVKRNNGVFYYKQAKIQQVDLWSQFDIYFGRVLNKWLLQLIRNKKLFLGLTHFNIFNADDLLMYYLNNKVRTGYKFGSSMKLANCMKNKANVTRLLGWVTNMRQDKIPYLQLTKLYYGNEKAYPKFIGTDIISVRQYVDIPKDYRGKMGIAISTFLSKYNPEQFKILGIERGLHTDRDKKTYNVLIVKRVD